MTAPTPHDTDRLRHAQAATFALNIAGLILSLLLVVALAWLAAGMLPTELEGHL
jgi:hypothetical protein